jgi:hypothetical protein
VAHDENRRVVARFDAILNTGDVSELDEICTPDMVNHSLGPRRPPGLAGTREYLTSAGRNFRSETWRDSIVVAEHDLVVQFGVRTGHWPGGPFFGFDAPAGPYTREVAFMYRLAQGCISERWAVRDDLGFLKRLGALAAPSSA